MNKTCGNCRSFDEETCLCCVHFDHFSEAYPDTEACELFEEIVPEIMIEVTERTVFDMRENAH